ncbi:MAG: single-stranded DNA-binding protein [Pseudonocardiaceae bacterium]
MNEPVTTLIGDLTSDVEFRIEDGMPEASFTVTWSPPWFDKPSGTWITPASLSVRCTAMGETARNMAVCLERGDRVIVTGYLRQRSSATREGERRRAIELAVTEVGASLRFTQIEVTRPGRAIPPVSGQDEPPA